VLNFASLPETTSFFQFGIIFNYHGWLQVAPAHFPYGPIIY